MFRSAAASEKSALEFYLKCVKTIRFDRRDARFSEYRDWRDKNEGKLKEKSNLVALRLQLEYLVLTLRAAEGVERELIVPEVEKFVAGIVTNVETLEGGGLKTLRDSVNRTVFAEAYELNQSMRVDSWHYSPADIGGMFDKIIFPYYRAEKQDGLATAWDRRIDYEKRLTEFTQENNVIALQKLEEERLPRLGWSKALDVFSSASQQDGALAMIRILQAHSDHPDATNWVKSMRGLLDPTEAETE